MIPPRLPPPAAPGRYRYDTDGETRISGGVESTRPLPAVTTLDISPPDGTSQRSVRDLRGAGGEGQTTETVLRHETAGVRLAFLEVTGRFSGISTTLTFRPSDPPLTYATGAEPGARYAFTLTGSDGRTTAEVTIDILRREPVAVHGSTVDTLRVRMHTVLTGDVEGETTSENNVDPNRSLTVREDVTSDVRVGLGRSRSTYVATLQTLQPS